MRASYAFVLQKNNAEVSTYSVLTPTFIIEPQKQGIDYADSLLWPLRVNSLFICDAKYLHDDCLHGPDRWHSLQRDRSFLHKKVRVVPDLHRDRQRI